MCIGNYIKIIIVIFILGFFLNKCNKPNETIPLDNFKGAVVSDKDRYGRFRVCLKIKGKKQDMQVDSFYYQYLYVIESDYIKYNINDTIK